MKLLNPDYTNCLVNLSNSILKYFEIKPYHKTLDKLDNILNRKNYKNVVLIVNDGLSSNILDKHLEKDAFLKIHKIADISSVFPATTVSAITSITTGLYPNEHCYLGWNSYIPDLDVVLTTFHNKDLMQTYFPNKTIMDRIIEENKFKAYGVLPYDNVPYILEKPKEMYERIESLCNEDGKKFIYAYYNNPDHLMHDHGTDNNKIKENIEFINEQIEQIANNLNDTLIIVTADHGLVDVKYKFLSNYPKLESTLSKNISLESRVVNFFIKEEQRDSFVTEFKKHFSDSFILLTREDVLAKKIFGIGQNHEKFESCLGDYLAIAKTNIAIDEIIDDDPLKADHGSISTNEINVPLIIIECAKNNIV